MPTAVPPTGPPLLARVPLPLNHATVPSGTPLPPTKMPCEYALAITLASIRVLLAPLRTSTPEFKSPSTAVPAAFVPIQLPWRVLPSVPASANDTPGPALPLTTLPSAARPTRVLNDPFETNTPANPLPTAAVPLASSPIRLLWIVLKNPTRPAPDTSTPPDVLPLMTLLLTLTANDPVSTRTPYPRLGTAAVPAGSVPR